jgi:hypothetical protein
MVVFARAMERSRARATRRRQRPCACLGYRPTTWVLCSPTHLAADGSEGSRLLRDEMHVAPIGHGDERLVGSRLSGQAEPRHDTDEVCEHVRAIVDEVRETEAFGDVACRSSPAVGRAALRFVLLATRRAAEPAPGRHCRRRGGGTDRAPMRVVGKLDQLTDTRHSPNSARPTGGGAARSTSHAIAAATDPIATNLRTNRARRLDPALAERIMRNVAGSSGSDSQLLRSHEKRCNRPRCADRGKGSQVSTRGAQ